MKELSKMGFVNGHVCTYMYVLKYVASTYDARQYLR